MKRKLLLFLSFFVTMTMLAEDVTPEQALEQAKKFIQKREASGSRKVRRAPGSPTPQLIMTTQKVNGLYAFNIADGGFVIVSNDDRTQPILGFSDSGSIDPDQMPSNMRAWLQGYADEIAWLNQHSETIIPLKGSLPQRVGSHSTTAIAPLISTKWNQDTPFNDLCPEYETGSRAVTGCVATAMAQVMKYHEWPQTQTAAVPGYSEDFRGVSCIVVGDLPATTFEWSNMKNSYSSGYTTAEGNAVAKLMQYCGWSVKMNYGPSSGSNTNMVATALKTYFDYNATAQVVSRSYYTAAKWADLIYHELSNGRPVVYGGQSSGGGHEFVCDGYKYENETDFFHINWGWGGMSDEYFVLSVLNPYAQGIGGSSSNDGFRYGQDAVIGIQKSTDNGSVANITPNVINLRMNSMTLSSDFVAVNTEVLVTMNIRNNSSDDFEGDIYLGLKVAGGYKLLGGNNFYIPAGQTVSCVIPFTPTEVGTYEFVFFWPNNSGSYTTNGVVGATLTVTDGFTPMNLTASDITYNSALISWTGNERVTSYKLRYGVLPEGLSLTSSTLKYDDGTPVTGPGTNGGQFYWAVKFPGGTYSGSKLTKVSAYDAMAMDGTVTVYNGNNTTSANLAGTKDISFTGINSFAEFTFDTPLDIDNTKDLWIVFYNESGATYPAVACNDPDSNDPNNRWISSDGTTWSDIGNQLPGYGWMIRGYTEGYDENDINWTTVSCEEDSYLLTNLTPETNYIVQVQALYDNETSNWSAMASFTTLPLLELTDDATNNGETLATHNGENTNVVLAGRTLYKDGAWNTLCLPFDVDLTDENSPLYGGIAKTLTDATMAGTYVTLIFGEAVTTLEAGTPYLIKWNGGDDIVNPVFSGVTISTTEGSTIEKAGGHVKFVGYYDAFEIDTPANDDIHYLTADNMLRHTGKKRTLNACRAYFRFSENIVNSAPRFVLDFGEGQTTTIDSSTIYNSQADSWYSVEGRKFNVKPTRKGLYIHNGKKEVVK